MINYSICVNKNSPARILSLLISLDKYTTTDYSVTILCDNKIQNLIENYPYNFRTPILFISSDVTDNTLERQMHLIKHCVSTFGNTLYISEDLILVKEFKLPDTLKDIMFVKKECSCHESSDLYKNNYTIDLLYIGSNDYINFMEEIINKWHKSKNEKSSEEHTNKKHLHLVSVIISNLIEKFSIDHFFDFNMCISTEDFFAYDNYYQIENIDDSLNYVISKNSENNNEVTTKYPLTFLNLRTNHSMDVVNELNNKIFTKIIEYDNTLIPIISLGHSGERHEIRIPKKEGIVIWDRSKTTHGFYETIDMITEKYNDYVTQKEYNMEYFSLNSLLLFDKPNKVWLTNNIMLYDKILMCNYDSELPAVLESTPINSGFLCYHSDEPRKLEENRDVYVKNKKVYDVVSVEQGVIKAFKYLEKTNRLRKKADLY